MNKLAYWRASRELTVRELSTKSRVSPTTINRLEKGYIKSNLVTLGKLANALGIDVSELAELAENPNCYALEINQVRAQRKATVIDTATAVAQL